MLDGVENQTAGITNHRPRLDGAGQDDARASVCPAGEAEALSS